MKKLLLIVLMVLSLQLFSEDYKVVLKKGVTLSQQEINKNMDDRYSHIRVLDIRYRSSDDTLVISAKAKPDQDSIMSNFQSTMERELAQMVRSEMCAGADTRDLMKIGRYAFEYRITTANGKKFKPVRISAKDCR